MRIYLDDCAHDADLVALLERDGHVVFTPTTERTRGADDSIHLASAVAPLHHGYLRRSRGHCGILLVYEVNNRAKDMDLRELASAIQTLAASGLALENQIHTLNHWR